MTPPRVPVRRLALVACLAAVLGGAPTGAAQEAPAPERAPAPVAIGALRADADGDGVPDRVGQRVLTGGRVTAGTGILRSDVAEIYLEDGTGGLRVVLGDDAPIVLTGDSLVVRGPLGFRNGMVTMTEPAVRTIPVPPHTVEPLDLDITSRPDGSEGPDIESAEGRVVGIEGRVVQSDSTAAGPTLLLLSGTDLVRVRAYRRRAAPLTFGDVRIGDYIRVQGIAVQNDPSPPHTGAYEILPLTESDVRRAGLSPGEYRVGVIATGVLLLLALLWGVMLWRQVRRRSEELDRSEARYGHLFDSAADAVFVVDLDRAGELIEANRAAQRAFGVIANGNKTDGRSVRLVELAVDAHEAAAHLTEVTRTGAASAVLELRDPEGEPVPFEVATRRVRDAGSTDVVSVARNVAQRRRYEHGLLEAIQAAEDARERAEEAARLKSSILANMSHEIRTPLTAILGFADLLAEEVDEDLFSYADTIRTGGRRLLDTLNDILDFARLDAERAPLRPEPVNVTDVVRDAVSLLAPLAQQKGLGLHLQSTAATIEAVHSQAALGRVVTNLAGNAIKFTDAGEVRVSVHGDDGFFAVRVQDTGVGISEEFLPDLYEAFKQESDGHERAFEGTGLGLAITKRLVDRMGGEIRVWSEKGEGTLFEVVFPTAAPDDAPVAPTDVPAIPPPPLGVGTLPSDPAPVSAPPAPAPTAPAPAPPADPAPSDPAPAASAPAPAPPAGDGHARPAAEFTPIL